MKIDTFQLSDLTMRKIVRIALVIIIILFDFIAGIKANFDILITLVIGIRGSFHCNFITKENRVGYPNDFAGLILWEIEYRNWY